MHYQTLASHLQHAAPIEKHMAEQVVLSILQELAGMLRGGSARALAEALAFPLADDENRQPLPDIGALRTRLARALSVDAMRAQEYLQITMAGLADHLTDGLLSKLHHELPDDVEALLQRDVTKGGQPPQRASGHGRQLADGRPGSRRPMSETAPGSSRPVSQAAPGPRHQNSVAERNPHADTKLSSAKGLTQEREGESRGNRRTSPDKN